MLEWMIFFVGMVIFFVGIHLKPLQSRTEVARCHKGIYKKNLYKTINKIVANNHAMCIFNREKPCNYWRTHTIQRKTQKLQSKNCKIHGENLVKNRFQKNIIFTAHKNKHTHKERETA